MVSSDFDHDAGTWTARIVRAYAAAAPMPVASEDKAGITRELIASVIECLNLAFPSSAWGSEYINPALVRWETSAHRTPGPRLVAVDYDEGTVTMV